MFRLIIFLLNERKYTSLMCAYVFVYVLRAYDVPRR